MCVRRCYKSNDLLSSKSDRGVWRERAADIRMSKKDRSIGANFAKTQWTMIIHAPNVRKTDTKYQIVSTRRATEEEKESNIGSKS